MTAGTAVGVAAQTVTTGTAVTADGHVVLVAVIPVVRHDRGVTAVTAVAAFTFAAPATCTAGTAKAAVITVTTVGRQHSTSRQQLNELRIDLGPAQDIRHSVPPSEHGPSNGPLQISRTGV